MGDLGAGATACRTLRGDLLPPAIKGGWAIVELPGQAGTSARPPGLCPRGHSGTGSPIQEPAWLRSSPVQLLRARGCRDSEDRWPAGWGLGLGFYWKTLTWILTAADCNLASLTMHGLKLFKAHHLIRLPTITLQFSTFAFWAWTGTGCCSLWKYKQCLVPSHYILG
jgi:hypothetical protein